MCAREQIKNIGNYSKIDTILIRSHGRGSYIIYLNNLLDAL